jgi:hypothetical protein
VTWIYVVISGTHLLFPSLCNWFAYSCLHKSIWHKSMNWHISPEIYSRLFDVTAFLYADKIRMLHAFGVATSTRVTPSPWHLSPCHCWLYFFSLCLSIIMLNPLNAPCEYKPYSYISQLFETHGTLCNIYILSSSPAQSAARGQYVVCDIVQSN